MHRTMMPRLFLAAALFALPWMTSAQPNENRGAMTLNEAGEVLRFVAEESNEPTAVLESGASSSDILGFGDTFQGEDVDGFGNIADLNDLGVAVMKVVTTFTVDTRGTEESKENAYLATSTNGGAPVAIAVANRLGVGSTTFGGDALCEIGPMPEINNSGQVAWFGQLVPSDGDIFECDRTDFDGNSGNSDAWNPNYINYEGTSSNTWDYFVADQDETTLSVSDNVTGTYVLSVDVFKSALFRYTPGGGHSVLLEGNIYGNADTLTVSNPDFVDSTIVYKVREVDFIRDGSQRMNEAGAIVAHVELFDGPTESGMFTGCTAVVDTINDNPFDNPDGSEPLIRYDTISCPGFARGSVTVEDALVVYNGSTPTVIAATGPDSIYNELVDEGAIINNSGQVLFRAVRDVPVRGASLATLELYTPGSGTTVIAWEGDPVPTPNSNHFFCEFPPHYDLAHDGSFAFQAQIGDCGQLRGGDGETAMFRYADGVITELFRTVDLEEVGVDVPSTWNGNDIDELSSVAISPTSGLVQFYVESSDAEAEPADCQEERGNFSTNFGGGEWTALVSWTELNGLETVMAEGDPIGAGDAYIFRIYAMGPKLRAQANSSAEMVALVDINRDGMDCDVDQDDEDIDETQVVLIGRGTPPVGSILEIPVAGPLGLGIFAAALLMLSMMWVRQRAPGV